MGIVYRFTAQPTEEFTVSIAEFRKKFAGWLPWSPSVELKWESGSQWVDLAGVMLFQKTDERLGLLRRSVSHVCDFISFIALFLSGLPLGYIPLAFSSLGHDALTFSRVFFGSDFIATKVVLLAVSGYGMRCLSHRIGRRIYPHHLSLRFIGTLIWAGAASVFFMTLLFVTGLCTWGTAPPGLTRDDPFPYFILVAGPPLGGYLTALFLAMLPKFMGHYPEPIRLLRQRVRATIAGLSLEDERWKRWWGGKFAPMLPMALGLGGAVLLWWLLVWFVWLVHHADIPKLIPMGIFTILFGLFSLWSTRGNLVAFGAEAMDGDSLQHADPRPFSLYLREFASDPDSTMIEPPDGVAFRLADILSLQGPVLAVRNYHSVIAYPGPSEVWPQNHGIVRSDQWPVFVEKLVLEAAMVFLRIGTTNGIREEVAILCAACAGHWDKVVLYFPEVGNAHRQARWTTFRDAATGLLPPLPAEDGGALLVSFTACGEVTMHRYTRVLECLADAFSREPRRLLRRVLPQLCVHLEPQMKDAWTPETPSWFPFSFVGPQIVICCGVACLTLGILNRYTDIRLSSDTRFVLLFLVVIVVPLGTVLRAFWKSVLYFWCFAPIRKVNRVFRYSPSVKKP